MRSIAISLITAIALAGPIAAQTDAPQSLAGQCFDLHARRYGSPVTHTVILTTATARSGSPEWLPRFVATPGRSSVRLARGLWRVPQSDSLMINVFYVDTGIDLRFGAVTADTTRGSGRNTGMEQDTITTHPALLIRRSQCWKPLVNSGFNVEVSSLFHRRVKSECNVSCGRGMRPLSSSRLLCWCLRSHTSATRPTVHRRPPK
jgi:hypothetical protein